MNYIVNSSRDRYSSAGLTPALYTGGVLRGEESYHFIYNGTTDHESSLMLSARPDKVSGSGARYIPVSTPEKFGAMYSHFKRPYGVASFDTSDGDEYAYGIRISSSKAPFQVTPTILVPENVLGASFANRVLGWLHGNDITRKVRYLSWNSNSVVQDLCGSDISVVDLPLNPGYSNSEVLPVRSHMASQLAPILDTGNRMLITYLDGNTREAAKMLRGILNAAHPLDSVLVNARVFSPALNRVLQDLNRRFYQKGIQFSWVYEDPGYTDPFGLVLEGALEVFIKGAVRDSSIIKLKQDGTKYYVSDSIQEGDRIWTSASTPIEVKSRGEIPLPLFDYQPPFWVGSRFKQYEVLYASFGAPGSISFGTAQLTEATLDEMAKYGKLAVPEGSFYTSQNYVLGKSSLEKLNFQEGMVGRSPTMWVRGSTMPVKREIVINEEYRQVLYRKTANVLLGYIEEEN